MSTSLRYGVIGTGMMGVEHINNLLHLPGATVTAISDPHAESRDWAQLAVGLDAPLARFADHGELLASGLCDVVVIASPNHTHHDVLSDVLRTGHHVLIEKPLCTTVADCRRVIALADETAQLWPQRVVWMGLEYRFMPPTQAIVREVRDGTVGRLRMVAIREHRFPFLVKVGNWNRFNRNTGGTLVEKCCHFFDLMNVLAADTPVRVLASGGQAVNHLDERYDGERPDILDNAYVIVEYEGGACDARPVHVRRGEQERAGDLRGRRRGQGGGTRHRRPRARRATFGRPRVRHRACRARRHHPSRRPAPRCVLPGARCVHGGHPRRRQRRSRCTTG